MYKYEEYDEKENIIMQGKSKVQVTNRENANLFLKTIGYKELIRIVDHIDVYEKEGLKFVLKMLMVNIYLLKLKKMKGIIL